MEVTYPKIIGNSHDFKVCKSCNSINYYENEICWNCQEDNFTETDSNLLYKLINLDYKYYEKEGFTEIEIDNIEITAR